MSMLVGTKAGSVYPCYKPLLRTYITTDNIIEDSQFDFNIF